LKQGKQLFHIFAVVYERICEFIIIPKFTS